MALPDRKPLSDTEIALVMFRADQLLHKTIRTREENEELKRLESLLDWLRKAQPVAFDRVATNLQKSVSASGGEMDLGAIFSQLTQAIAAAAGGRREPQDVFTKTTTTGGVTEITTREIGRTAFVDVPTPEEFLDDWENAFAGYMYSLFNSGQINRETLDYAFANRTVFLNRYLAALSERMARGEDIFKVVGLTGPVQTIGHRFGGREVTGVTTERSEYSRGESVSREGPPPPPGVSEAQLRAVQEAYKRDPVAADRFFKTLAVQEAYRRDPVAAQRFFEAAAKNPEAVARLVGGGGGAFPQTESGLPARQTTERTQRGRDVARETTTVLEEIVRRPKLGLVFAYSPMDFLQQTLDADTLIAMAAGPRGERRPFTETPYVSGVRRL